MVGGAWTGKRRGDLPDSFDFHFQICSQLSVLSVNELVTLCLSQACNVVKFTYRGGSQLEVILLPKGHWTISGDIFGCHNSG